MWNHRCDTTFKEAHFQGGNEELLRRNKVQERLMEKVTKWGRKLIWFRENGGGKSQEV